MVDTSLGLGEEIVVALGWCCTTYAGRRLAWYVFATSQLTSE